MYYTGHQSKLEITRILHSKKIKRSIGILSKILDALPNLYYALINPSLIYGIVIWGNTYPNNIQALFILQKLSIRIVTFSKFDDHSSPLFKQTNTLKLIDLITFHVRFLCSNSTINYQGPRSNFDIFLLGGGGGRGHR